MKKSKKLTGDIQPKPRVVKTAARRMRAFGESPEGVKIQEVLAPADSAALGHGR